MQDIKEHIAAQCRNEFMKDPKGYCCQLKIKETTTELYEIGIVPEEGLFSMLESAGYSSDIIKALNFSDYKNRFCFPSRTAEGVISAFYFKRSNNSFQQPTWICRSCGLSDLYGINKCVPNKNYVLLCEGVGDVLACANVGIPNATTYGNGRFPTEEQISALGRFKTVVLAFDNDEYGKETSEKVRTALASNGIAAITLAYENRDIGEAMRDLTQRRLIINQLKTIMNL